MRLKLNLLTKRNDPNDGYGRWGLRLRDALRRQGVTVRALHSSTLTTKVVDWQRLTLAVMYGEDFVPVAGRLWVWTMWEDTRPPPSWIRKINAYAERLIVPCPHNAEAFRGSGVRIHISIIPGGIDPAEFPPVECFPARPFTFLTIGDRGTRKGWDTAFMAFSKAFPAALYPDVRLIIKARKFMFKFPDPRIVIQVEDAPDMAAVYRQADCLVFPSKGEGWGLPPREAAAMGIPTIATRYAGLEVGIDQWCTMPLEPRIMDSIMGYGGTWGIPEMDDTVAAMRDVYTHRDEARQKARVQADWLRNNQTWDHSACSLIEQMGIYA